MDESINNEPEIIELISDKEIMSSFDVMNVLRPHVKKEDYLAQVKRQQKTGFQLVGVRRGGRIIAIAGFRISEYLAKGKHVYIDDLVTFESERSGGYGKLLMKWVGDYGAKNGCKQLYLDSGVQRQDAHRFYFRERMHIMAYHFAMDI